VRIIALTSLSGFERLSFPDNILNRALGNAQVLCDLAH
jgi:hypothetical protein